MLTILWGAQTHYKKLTKKHSPHFDCHVKNSVADGVHLNCRPVKKSEIAELSEALVVIGYGKKESCLRVVDFCKENGIKYTLLDIFMGKAITAEMIAKLGGSFTDENNNTVIIDGGSHLCGPIYVKFKKDTKNAVVDIEKISVEKGMFINVKGKNARVKIHCGSYFYDVNIRCCTNGKIEIGESCLFSHGVELSQSDQHCIFDLNTHERINWAKDINIGNHVWVGRSVHLLGGANIGNGCILGDSCVTSSTFSPNCVIAGNSGRVIRENVIWSRDSIRYNDAKTLEDCKDKRGLDYL
ncbi:MAG: hypothetical protein LUH82_00375 [Clostridiales bacterium]|nr:hypothetical protein [Clostridiales bacterium]